MPLFARPRGAPAILAGALLLAGCSFADETILPTLSGENPRATAAAREAAAARAGGSGGATPAGEQSGAPPRAGTDLAGDLARVQRQLAARQSELEAIRRRLAEAGNRYEQAARGAESGMRTGDARVAVQRGEAETQLARTSSEVARLNALSAATASDGTLANYVAQAARAAAAESADPARQARLAELDRGGAKAAGEADRLLVEIGGEIAEQSRRVSAERRRLAALGAPIVPASAPAAAAPQPPRAGERRALVTIRFDAPDATYQDQLSGAVRQALQRRPDLAFDIVAVNPPGAAPDDAVAASRRNMAGVIRTLSSLGVAGDKMRLSSTVDAGATVPEVRLYPR